MKPPQIVYGKLIDEIVHIEDVDRGRACECTCLECGRPLVAKKGEKLSHHFAHDTDDVSCNPSPESLVHSYAKQQVGKLQELILPGFTVTAIVESTDGQMHELHRRYHPHYRLKVRSAEVEADLGNIQPDVLFVTEYGRIAFEVFFRHQVPLEKIEKLKYHHYLSAIEIDLSDLPVDSSSHAINQAISDVKRWNWLHNQHMTYIQGEMASMLARSTRIFVPEPVERIPRIALRTLPSKKLAKADKLNFKAKRFIHELRQLSVEERVERVLCLENELRIAIHCELIGITPTKLPLHLMQSINGQGALGVHPVVWQTGVYAKYCMAGGEFTAKEVEQWLRKTIKDKAFSSALSITQTTNGFSPVAEGIYHFLRNLSVQGLLFEIKGRKPWDSRFKPLYETKEETLKALLSLPSALGTLHIA